MGVDVFAMVFGLGFVLSFGYWCTNFLVVQRAMAAKNMTAARRTPLVAAMPKMLFPALVILPGMIAVALTAMPDKDYRIPPPDHCSGESTPRPSRRSSSNTRSAGSPPPKSRTSATRSGQKVNADKITALITANAATKLADDQIKEGIYRRRGRDTITTASSSRS